MTRRSVVVGCTSLSSDRSEVCYSNPERSKALRLSKPNDLHNVSSGLITYNRAYSANNNSPISFNNPQAHSSPKISKHNITLNEPESSRILRTATNSLNTKQPSTAITLNTSIIANTNKISSSNSRPDLALNSNPNQSENIAQLHNNVSDQVDSIVKTKIEDYQTSNAKAAATAASENSKIAYGISTTINERTKYDGDFFNETDSSKDILQMGLNLKMFPTRITPYLNSLKLDFLQLLNNYRTQTEPANKQAIRGSKTVGDIIKNIENILKLNANTSTGTESKRKKCSTVQFSTVDFNALDVLNRKLDGVYRRIESVGLTNKTKTVQKIHEQSETNLDAQHNNDYGELGHSNRFLTESEPFEPVINGDGNSASDSSQRVRSSNESIDLSLSAKENCTVYNDISSPTRESSLDNLSLNDLVGLQDKETPESVMSDIQLRETEFVSDTSTSANTSFSNNPHEDISNGIQTNETKTVQKIHEQSETNLDAQHNNDYGELGHSNRFLTESEPFESFINGDGNSSTGNSASDSSQRVRSSNESIDLSLSAKENGTLCNDTNTQTRESSLDNISLIDLVGLQDKETPESVMMSDIQLRETEFLSDTSTPANTRFSYNPHVDTSNGIQTEKAENQHYSLRKCPKSTKRFFVEPFKQTPVKRKSSRVKNDVFVCRGSGKNKVVLQYQVKSVLKANSSELMKKISPESVNRRENNDHNATSLDISNLIPKKNGKPCRCGILPSQVPPSWYSLLHKHIHRNLHKLRFKSQTTVDVVSKFNNDGYIYDIMNVTNSTNDKHLKLTLKNINEFIDIELNHHSIKNINNLNRSIFVAVNPNSEIIGYLETESLKNACILRNNELSEDLITVKFGVSKLWVMVKYRNNGIASNLLKQFCIGKNVYINDIAFAYRGGQGISFIKKYFKNNSVLIY